MAPCRSLSKVRVSRLGLVVRHPDVDLDPVALRARRFHLLEPERRPAAVRVDQVLLAGVVLASSLSSPRRSAGAAFFLVLFSILVRAAGRGDGRSWPPTISFNWCSWGVCAAAS
jgi:hypothetical protein